ncbi:MAG: alanine racemase [Granulosicoccus sp.]
MPSKDIELNSASDCADPSYRRSVSITVNLDTLRRNLATARRLSAGSKQFATIKADAYGHGAVAVAQALSSIEWQKSCLDWVPATAEPENGNADGFAVVTLGEAMELRESGIEQPVLVLQGPQNSGACESMREHNLWPVIHDIDQYNWYREQSNCRSLKAWLKVDSGMGRLGVQPVQASRILNTQDNVSWMGLMTHFACSDEVDNPFTDQQLAVFNSVESDQPLSRSLANSSAVLAWPQTRADWARPGIMLYGCNPLDRELPPGISLEPAMRVQAPVISIKQISAGSSIGYAQRYFCAEDMPVAYIALGYRDGLPRVLDESASVVLQGQPCPIIGRVSMDSIAVDLRPVPRVGLGTMAEFWGAEASINALAQAAGTINYELLTSIRGRRIYVTDS